MANLVFDSSSEPVETKGRWDSWLKIFLIVLIVFFSWVILSNGFLLIFGTPLINTHH
ncbi:MAG: hypothetical protein H0X25_07875 [Acidobacteriales bacterium]|nr:hypothetical protein [Terriglobales bacterium]